MTIARVALLNLTLLRGVSGVSETIGSEEFLGQ